MKITIAFFVCFSLALNGLVDAWGQEGHQIVAQIALNMLNSNAINEVNQYEGESGETLPAMAPLPDAYDHTSQGRWSAPMHYCNLPRDATSFQMSYCPNLCVVKAIQNYTAILSQETPSPCNFDQEDGIEPCALEFLVHFIGDVHQPLHVGYGDDAGGNKVKVSWYGQSVNLHQVWDEKIIQKWDSSYQDATSDLENMMSQNASLVQQFAADTNPIDWANESFGYVLSTVYNFTDSYSVDSGSVPQLGDVYYNRNLPIVQLRLIAGGVRLGTSLNSLLGAETAIKVLTQYIGRISFYNKMFGAERQVQNRMVVNN